MSLLARGEQDRPLNRRETADYCHPTFTKC